MSQPDYPVPPKTYLSINVELPCGCVMTQSVVSDKPASGAQGAELIASSSRALTAWLEDRWGRHSCYLVSSSNPNGIAPRK